MKQLSQFSLLILGLAVIFTGCDQAQQAAQDVAEQAKDKVADIDFGDFDMTGLQEKFTGITDGFKNVAADNVEGLTSKITDLTGSLEGLGIDKLPGPAKTAVTAAISKFSDTIKSAMEGISDEGILSKLKPVVEALMEKVKAFM